MNIKKELSKLVRDINPKEISSQIESDSLRTWCNAIGNAFSYYIDMLNDGDSPSITDKSSKYPLGSKWFYKEDGYMIPCRVTKIIVGFSEVEIIVSADYMKPTNSQNCFGSWCARNIVEWFDEKLIPR